MAQMQCYCGTRLSTTSSPNEIEYKCFSFEEWNHILSLGVVEFEKIGFGETKYDLWACPKCKRIYIFEKIRLNCFKKKSFTLYDGCKKNTKINILNTFLICYSEFDFEKYFTEHDVDTNKMPPASVVIYKVDENTLVWVNQSEKQKLQVYIHEKEIIYSI